MSTANLTNTCASCGAEESLDALLLRMIDDDQVRRLIADVITLSIPLGGLVVRYLRLHKPAKQKLRMDKVGKLLGELVPDILRTSIERKGRTWVIGTEGWKLALEAVFAAQTKGTLTLPLEGNGYLYEVLMRLADKAEASAEKTTEAAKLGRAHQSGAQSIADLAAGAIGKGAAVAPAAALQIAAPRERVESPTVKAFKAQVKAASNNLPTTA